MVNLKNSNNDTFDKISKYWSDQINNEIYLIKSDKNYTSGSKEYYDFIKGKRNKYLYYLPDVLTFLKKNIQSGNKLLEVGCGAGLDLLMLNDNGFSCHGIDLADEHINLAAKCFEIYNKKAEIKKDNAESISYPDNYFDFVYSHGVIHHTPNPQKAINEVYRVLKYNGHAYIMLYHKYSLNNLVHTIFNIPYENPKKSNKISKDSPFTYTYSKSDVKKLCGKFSDIKILTRYLYGPCWGKIYDFTPNFIYKPISRLFGWHLIILLTK